MDQPTQTPEASGPSSHEEAAPTTPERFPLSPKEMIRQIYLISGAVVVLLSLAIWLMMILS